jgi:hypothetical protein
VKYQRVNALMQARRGIRGVARGGPGGEGADGGGELDEEEVILQKVEVLEKQMEEVRRQRRASASRLPL